jgi:hypothetical protein
LRLTVALAAIFGTLLGLETTAPAQGSGSWAFCYVDPHTFQSGSYVYTRVIYVGGAPIPRGEIAAAMAQANPQVAGRPISCWRYPSQQQAEAKRREGMNLDKGRGYAVQEISWASPYSPGSEPEQAILEPPASTTTTPPAPVTSQAADAPAGKPASAKAPPAKPQWEIEYEAKMAVYEQEMARQKAAVAEFERAQAELARSREEQAERARKAKEDWEKAVAACKAGDHSKCAKTSEEPQ